MMESVGPPISVNDETPISGSSEIHPKAVMFKCSERNIIKMLKTAR